MFYVYQWYNTETQEIFYIGKGCGNRYKSMDKRNQKFKDYCKNNPHDSKIIAYFEQEKDALSFEREKIIELKALGQCCCNLDNRGTGGLGFVWTPEMREYKSQYNPMKREEQRERMSKNNPMKNPEVAEKVASKNRKIIVYNNENVTAELLAEKLNLNIATIWNWAKRGYDTDGNPCYYLGETSPKSKKTTNSKAIYLNDIYFESLRAAADYLGVKDTSPLCKALKNGKTYKGYTCKYANQQPSEGNSNYSTLEGSETSR